MSTENTVPLHTEKGKILSTVSIAFVHTDKGKITQTHKHTHTHSHTNTHCIGMYVYDAEHSQERPLLDKVHSE